jgi:hypothetical protein
MAMFSVFQPYDDEGFQLLTVGSYVSGHTLYTQLMTNHGPFFYEVMGGFFKVTGIGVTNDSGRLVTLFIWLLASLGSGLVVYRLTRSLVLAVTSLLLTFNLLEALTNEPMQPGGLLSLLLVGLALAAAYRSRWPRATAVSIGALVAATCLVKINVGAFAAMAVAFAFAGSLAARWRRLLVPATGLVLAVVPFALMLRLLDRDWAIYYALAAALAALALTVVVTAAGPKAAAAPAAWLMVGSGAAVAIATVGIAVRTGTRLLDLLNWIVLIAYRQPLLYVQPLNVRAWVVVFAAASAALAIAFVVFRARGPVSGLLPATARVAAGVVMWICVLLPPSYLLMLAVALVWVAALAPRDDLDSPTDAYSRLLLPALALMECLQAFPIAGTQAAIASLGVVLVGAIAINDGVRQLRAWGAGRSRPRLVAAANFVPVAALVFSLAATSLWGLVAAGGYAAGSPLALPGGHLLRVPHVQQVALGSLTTAIRKDCDSFITEPAMPSFYGWTQQPAPAQLYSTDWIYLLDRAQEQSIVDQVKARPRLCVVRNDAVVKFWAQGKPAASGPLIGFIDTNFVVSGSYGDYDLMTRVDIAR